MSKLLLNINGEPREIEVDQAMPLLWVLRDHLGLLGANSVAARAVRRLYHPFRQRPILMNGDRAMDVRKSLSLRDVCAHQEGRATSRGDREASTPIAVA